ncbi:MAG: hypothetical protein P4L67_04330 [Candidatus Pacebacteria bacterium]|nr:hypothetical protein [Candidatus Paceibacterota bacterium]
MSDLPEELQEAIDEERWAYAIKMATDSGYDVYITITPTEDGSKGIVTLVDEHD